MNREVLLLHKPLGSLRSSTCYNLAYGLRLLGLESCPTSAASDLIRPSLWGQMWELNPLREGYEPCDLAVCPI